MMNRFFIFTSTAALLPILLFAAPIWGQSHPPARIEKPEAPQSQTSAPEPTKAETLDYIHGKLLGLAFITLHLDDIQVSEEDCSLNEVSDTGWRRESFIQLKNLDPNSTSWQIDDKSVTNYPKLTLKIVSRSNLEADTVKTSKDSGKTWTTQHLGYAAFDFDLKAATEIPDFQGKMERAFKHIVTLCSGVPAKELF
jgi:hypothetical protein